VRETRKYKLGELAALLEVKLQGDENWEIDGLATLKNADSSKLSFLSNPAYTDQLKNCKAGAIIIAPGLVDACPTNKLLSATPYVSYARASALFVSNSGQNSVTDASAVVHSSARIGQGVTIAANATIGPNVEIGDNTYIGPGSVVGDNCQLGSGCKLHANVTMYHDVVLGRNVAIHSGAVIGADGFGFAFDGKQSIKIHQLGGVRIGDDVEIGAATTIDRGAIEDTIIEQGVKIDNQVQIGHNCIVGEHSVICGCAAIAGSVTIGRYCILGGGSGAVGHITIADKVQVSAMSLISQSITRPGMYSSGTGHMETGAWKRNVVRFKQLDDMAKRLKELEKLTDKYKG